MPTIVTHTLRSSGGDYSTMSGWEATEQRDLTLADEQEVLECYADWPTTGLLDSVIISGWVVSATQNIVIRPASGHEHGGDRFSGFIINNDVNSSQSTIQLSQEWVELYDVVARNNRLRSAINIGGTANGSKVHRCIAWAERTDGAQQHAGILCGRADSATVWNCLIINEAILAGAIYMDRRAVGASVYNCTLIGADKAVEYGSGTDVRWDFRNCIMYGANATAEEIGTDWNASTNNAVFNTNEQVGANVQVFQLTDFEDFDGSNFDTADFRPAAGGAPFGGTGINNSGFYPNDISNQPHNLPYDIGAYKITGGAPVDKKVDVNVGGVWKKGVPYVNVGGAWKKGVANVVSGGAWKEST